MGRYNRCILRDRSCLSIRTNAGRSSSAPHCPQGRITPRTRPKSPSIRGEKCKVEQQDEKGIGQLWVSSQWTMQGRRNKWQNTGDLVYCNTLGYYFYAGRADKMVVCGGENIYPEVVERTLCNHPKVFTARVIPSENLRQGNRLEAIV